jgi:hypothetical protein
MLHDPERRVNMSNDYEQYDGDENYEDDMKYYPEDSIHKHYFKFDAAAWDAWGKWLHDAMKEIVETNPNVWYTPTYIEGFPIKKFPVTGSSHQDTEKNKTFLYLGNNQYHEPIWKKKYFVRDPIQSMYIDHLSNHATYFIKQPHYYRSLFEILN